MALRKSPQQAAASALRTWLESQLEDVTVLDRWPDPDNALPADVCISVTLIGTPDDTQLEPEVIGTVDPLGGDIYIYTWRVLERRQRLQVDVWAKFDAVRDDALLRIEEAVHAGTSPLGVRSDPIDSGLALDLTDEGWEDQVADIEIGQPEIDDTPDAHMRGEFRGSLRGFATMNLTIKTQTPKLTTVRASLLLNERGITGTTDITTP